MAEMRQAPKGGGVGRGPSDLPRRPRQIAHRYGRAIFDLTAVGAHLPAVEDRLVPVPVILRRSGVIHGGTGVIEVAFQVPRSSPERSKARGLPPPAAIGLVGSTWMTTKPPGMGSRIFGAMRISPSSTMATR